MAAAGRAGNDPPVCRRLFSIPSSSAPQLSTFFLGLFAVTTLLGCGRVDFDPLNANAATLSSGISHSCVIAAGRLYCWGDNTNGQVGDGTTSNAPGPAEVIGLPGVPTAVDCGHHHTCALVDGGAHCWGQGDSGQLGDGMGRDSAQPVAVMGLPSPVTRVSGGLNFTCAVAAGRAYCWGADRQGSLGQIVPGNLSLPAAVEFDEDVVDIAAGGDHTCAISSDRSQAWCWGHNDNGALGNASAAGSERTPMRVEFPPSVTRVEEIGIAGFHACARTDRGVFCWGTGTSGELGDGRLMHSNVPVQVPALPAATSTSALSVNGNGTFRDANCVVASGEVKCWGVNTTGRIGDGTTADRGIPTTATGVTAVVVATGSDHTCSRSADGIVSCWGAGAAGQLGDGLMTDSLTARRVMAVW